jgi:hypothetical protein
MPCGIASTVMPALVAGIHVFGAASKTRMAGTSPAMTSRYCPPKQVHAWRYAATVSHDAGIFLTRSQFRKLMPIKFGRSGYCLKPDRKHRGAPVHVRGFLCECDGFYRLPCLIRFVACQSSPGRSCQLSCALRQSTRTIRLALMQLRLETRSPPELFATNAGRA